MAHPKFLIINNAIPQGFRRALADFRCHHASPKFCCYPAGIFCAEHSEKKHKIAYIPAGLQERGFPHTLEYFNIAQ